jgi:hypothetical protein
MSSPAEYPQPPTAEALALAHFGFNILKLLGQGIFGRVFQVEDNLGHVFAAKVLYDSQANRKELELFDLVVKFDIFFVLYSTPYPVR